MKVACDVLSVATIGVGSGVVVSGMMCGSVVALLLGIFLCLLGGLAYLYHCMFTEKAFGAFEPHGPGGPALTETQRVRQTPGHTSR